MTYIVLKTPLNSNQPTNQHINSGLAAISRYIWISLFSLP